jgi:hypothetical protein
MIENSLSSKHFQAKDVVEILGKDIDKNKLFYWIRTYQLLKPEIEEASGTGTRTKFSLKNLLELSLIRELINFGFDLATVRVVKHGIDNYKSDLLKKKNIYDSILEDENKEEFVLFLYKTKKKIYLDISRLDIEPDFDGEQWIPNWTPSYVRLDQEGKKKRPEMFVSLKLELGRLAMDLVSKVKKL